MDTIDRHRQAILDGEVTGTNIIGMRKALTLAAKGDARWGSLPKYATPAWRTRVWELEQVLEDAQPKPTVKGAWHDSGVKVLRNKRYKSRWTPHQQAIIDELDHFKLIGFERIGLSGVYATPMFRAVGHSGLGFAFINIPWQSGGKGPEAV